MDIKPENTKLAICNQEVNENSALFDILLAPVFNQGVFNCYSIQETVSLESVFLPSL